jgi:ATP-dependent protease HslVU (ClpYQ) peptidase subunit
MSSTKSLIECLQDEIKQIDEELTKEFAKQVKDSRKQDELLKKRHKCVVEKWNEWDKQDKEWKKRYEWDSQDEEK